MDKFFNKFSWHSSTGFDEHFDKNKKIVKKLPNTREARSHFLVVANDYLIHKSSRALWKVTDDGNHIEALFDDDVLTEDQLQTGSEI